MFRIDLLGIISEAPSTPYPYGRLINSNPPGSGNGSPAIAEWGNDAVLGMYAALSHFGLTPSNLQEQVGDSDMVRLLQACLPVGALIEFAIDTDPSILDIRALVCDGSTVSEVTYADLFAILGTKWNIGGEPGGEFRLPDYRGKFVRGFDAGAGVDTGRVFAAPQLDAFQGHIHTPQAGATNSGGTVRDLSLLVGEGIQVAPTGSIRFIEPESGGTQTDGVNGTPRIGPQTRPINETAQILIRF